MSLSSVSSVSPHDRTVMVWSRCSGVSSRLEQQLGQAEDAVHRRAQLVAHVGDELRLEARRFERLVAGRCQLGIGALALGDVSRHGLEAARPLSSASICTFCPIQTRFAVAVERRELEVGCRARGCRTAARRTAPTSLLASGATRSRKWQPMSDS